MQRFFSKTWWQHWGVVVLAWIVVITAMYLVMDRFIERQRVPNRADELSGRMLTLKRARDGHFRLQGSINNQAVLMTIDTGASSIAMDESLARRIGLPSTGVLVELSTAHGTVEGYEVLLKEVRLGDIVLYNVRADVSPGFGNPDEVLLGMSALRRLALTMQGDTLRIASPAE